EATLHRIQQLVHEKAMYAPVWELGFIHAHGSRVAESGLGLITGWAFSAPYEEVKVAPAMIDVDALTLARLIRSKEVSPVALVDAVLARIEALQPTVNAF